ncbi:MAG TPA: hypothetical protein VI793_17220 [Anaerolineales bacterium]|nr:hypothetical protein [Anaerolineales bacterium]
MQFELLLRGQTIEQRFDEASRQEALTAALAWLPKDERFSSESA